jgi:hypothetical protein
MKHLQDRKNTLVEYLQSCVDAEDWHGVRDAACDIEIIESYMKGLWEMRKETTKDYEVAK